MSRKSIKHLKNLAPSEVFYILKNLKWEVSEKLDGSNIEFGFDEKGFYTSREEFGGTRYYSVSDYPDTMASEFGVKSHVVLESKQEEFKAAGMKVGDKVNCEALIGKCPNTIPYGNDMIIYLSSDTIDINALPTFSNVNTTVPVPTFDGSGTVSYPVHDVCITVGVNKQFTFNIGLDTVLKRKLDWLLDTIEWYDSSCKYRVFEIAESKKNKHDKDHWKKFKEQKHDIDWARAEVDFVTETMYEYMYSYFLEKLKPQLLSPKRTTEGFVISVGDVTFKMINSSFMKMKNAKWESSEIFCYGKQSLQSKFKAYLAENYNTATAESVLDLIDEYLYAASIEYTMFLDRNRVSHLAEWDHKMYNYLCHYLINTQEKVSNCKTDSELRTLIKDLI